MHDDGAADDLSELDFEDLQQLGRFTLRGEVRVHRDRICSPTQRDRAEPDGRADRAPVASTRARTTRARADGVGGAACFVGERRAGRRARGSTG